jgi:HPt (histidine-containing phosphotransfer) domain-containing protein
LAVSGWDFDLYSELLDTFYREGLIKIKEMKAALEAGDIALYTVHVHALKSACANIGAGRLSEAAERLEKAGGLKDREYINEHNGRFSESLEKLLKDIAGQNQAGEASAPDFDIEKVRAGLAGLKAALDNYDISAGSKIMADLRRLTQSSEMNAVIMQISDNILTGGYDEAVLLTEKLLQE